MAASKNRGLGKGLDALFEEVSIVDTDFDMEKKDDKADSGSNDGILYVDIHEIKPNENQPRRSFDEEKLQELADSIREHGIIQPIVLRKIANGHEIVAGERRWRAARKAGLSKVPCVVRELTDEQNMLIAIIENMQREDLNPIEEAEGLNTMIKNFGMTQEEISKSVGKSRPYIANALRLLKLSDKVKKYAGEGLISAGHARTIAGIKDEAIQDALAERIVKEGLSVRQLEEIVKSSGESKAPKKRRKRVKTSDIIQVEEELKAVLGTKVNLNGKEKKGKIEIEYYSKDELERLIELLKSL